MRIREGVNGDQIVRGISFQQFFFRYVERRGFGERLQVGKGYFCYLVYFLILVGVEGFEVGGEGLGGLYLMGGGWRWEQNIEVSQSQCFRLQFYSWLFSQSVNNLFYVWEFLVLEGKGGVFRGKREFGLYVWGFLVYWKKYNLGNFQLGILVW